MDFAVAVIEQINSILITKNLDILCLDLQLKESGERTGDKINVGCGEIFTENWFSESFSLGFYINFNVVSLHPFLRSNL